MTHAASVPTALTPGWSMIIPYYNEEKFLPATLASIAAQSLAPQAIILVDNNSTDRSNVVIEEFTRTHPKLTIIRLHETTPGKAAATKTGIAQLTTEFVALCDADTIYPPHYLQTAQDIFDKSAAPIGGAFAFGVSSPTGTAQFFTRAKGALIGRLLARQCHTGGYGQTFRTKTLCDIGGLDPARWPFCLMDHELAHRAAKIGPIRYHFNFWCQTSTRRENRSNVRWTLFERLAYHATPFPYKDWYFYHFLKSRFEKRGISELNLRRRQWEQP